MVLNNNTPKVAKILKECQKSLYNKTSRKTVIKKKRNSCFVKSSTKVCAFQYLILKIPSLSGISGIFANLTFLISMLTEIHAHWKG